MTAKPLKPNRAAKAILKRFGYYSSGRTDIRREASEILVRMLALSRAATGVSGDDMTDALTLEAGKLGHPHRDANGNRRHVCPICGRVHRDYEEPESCKEAWQYLCHAGFAERDFLEAGKLLAKAVQFFQHGRARF